MKTKKMLYDLIIIGSGPAGLTAAIYASRYNLNFLVIGKLLGGEISEAHKICNFPTQNNIKGFELIKQMVNHVKELNGKIEQKEVIEIKKLNNKFIIKTHNQEYYSRKVILAIGREKQKLGVKGEDKFLSNGVSYCAVCDSAFYKDKIVAVCGGGNSAITSALLLAEYAKEVYIIYRKDSFFRAEPSWVNQLEKNKKIKKIFNSEIKEIYGGNSVKGVRLNNDNLLKLEGVFIEIGSIPNEKFSKQLGLKTEEGYIKVNKKQKTNIKGVFAAGDITNNPLKQVITACGEGAITVTSAYEEIKLEKSKR